MAKKINPSQILIDKILSLIDELQSLETSTNGLAFVEKLYELEPIIQNTSEVNVLKEIYRVLQTAIHDFKSERILKEATHYIINLLENRHHFREEKLINESAVFNLKKELLYNQERYAQILKKKKAIELEMTGLSVGEPNYFLLKSDYDQTLREIEGYTGIFKALYQRLQNSGITKNFLTKMISFEQIQKINDISFGDSNYIKQKLDFISEEIEKDNQRFVSLDEDYGKKFDEIIESNTITKIYKESVSQDEAYESVSKLDIHHIHQSLIDLNIKINELSENALEHDDIIKFINEAAYTAIDIYSQKNPIQESLISSVNKLEKQVQSKDLKTIVKGVIDVFDPPALDVGYYKIRQHIEMFFKYKHRIDFFQKPYIEMRPIERFNQIFTDDKATKLAKVWGRCNNMVHGNIVNFKKIDEQPNANIDNLIRDLNLVIDIGAYLSEKELDELIDFDTAQNQKLDNLVNTRVSGKIVKVFEKKNDQETRIYGFILVPNQSNEIYFNDDKLSFTPQIDTEVDFFLTSFYDHVKKITMYKATDLKLL